MMNMKSVLHVFIYVVNIWQTFTFAMQRNSFQWFCCCCCCLFTLLFFFRGPKSTKPKITDTSISENIHFSNRLSSNSLDIYSTYFLHCVETYESFEAWPANAQIACAVPLNTSTSQHLPSAASSGLQQKTQFCHRWRPLKYLRTRHQNASLHRSSSHRRDTTSSQFLCQRKSPRSHWRTTVPVKVILILSPQNK